MQQDRMLPPENGRSQGPPEKDARNRQVMCSRRIMDCTILLQVPAALSSCTDSMPATRTHSTVFK